MNRVLLLAAAAAMSLSTASVSAAETPGRVVFHKLHCVRTARVSALLYDQNSNPTGVGIDSQNFTSGTFQSYNDAGADDFVVPAKTRWKITEVDACGTYFNGSGPAKSENVIFYGNNRGAPGNPVRGGTFTGVSGKDDHGDFSIRLPHKGVRLKPGTYWVSVVANCEFDSCGEWGWDINSVIHGNQAMWEYPAFGSPCPTWGTIGYCIGYSGDFMFDLRGIARHE